MNSINVYWAPISQYYQNQLYREPNLVKDDLLLLRNKSQKGSIFACPAHTDLMRNLYVFKSNINDKIEIPERFLNIISDEEDSEVNEGLARLNSLVGLGNHRATSLVGYKNMEYAMGWIFFAEEPLVARFTAPYLPTHAPANGVILSAGEFDIGQWARPFNLDYFIPNDTRTFEYKVDDPFFYVQFLTEKEVNLKRFKTTPKFDDIWQESVQSPSRYGKRKPLSYRYEMAKRAKIREVVLSEIKNNLVD